MKVRNFFYDEDDLLVAHTELVDATDKYDFAYYLYRDKVRIATRGYEKHPVAVFRIPAEGGKFHVTAFAKQLETGKIQRSDAPSVVRSKVIESLSFIGKYPSDPDHISVEELSFKMKGSSNFRADVTVEHCTFPIFGKTSTEKRLFILLVGAASSRDFSKFPNFNRWSWADLFPGVVLSIADPTLAADPALLLGWYVGTSGINVSKELAALVTRIAVANGIDRSNIIFYGSSGGGFAAMMLAPLVGGGATAVAINPQTRIIKYAKGPLNAFLLAAFPGLNPEAAEIKHAERLSAIHVWSNEISMDSRLLLIQNTRDWHYESHFLPMLKALEIGDAGMSEDGRIRAHIFEDERGHSGVDTKETLPDILTMAMNIKY
jgi:hypothetical protein